MSGHFSLNGSVSSKGKNAPLAERDRQASQMLSTRYEALNQLLSEAERHLRGLKPVHPVWVDYERVYPPGGVAYWEVLGISKYVDRWRLCHAYDNEMNEEGFLEIKPIVECPVEVRVRAANEVRRLHEAIIKSKEDYVPCVDKAIEDLTKMCEEI